MNRCLSSGVDDANQTPNYDSFAATSEEQKLLRQLRGNPLWAEQFKAIANKFEQEIANGMDAHQAEAAMIESLQELGKSMMPQWAKNTQNKIIRIEAPRYAIDKATDQIFQQAKHFNAQAPDCINPADTLISEVDGSMPPVVGFHEEASAHDARANGYTKTPLLSTPLR